MAETLDNTIASLDDLNTKTIRAGIEFQGFAKSITQAADTATNAGKKWTVFSRLVSGTPIWAMQNKIRAYLAILGGFEERSKANAKAMSEQNKKFVEQMKGFKKVNEEFTTLNQQMSLFQSGTKTMEDFNAAAKAAGVSGLEALENSLKYQTVLAATNDERLAAAAAMEDMKGKMEELSEKEKDMIKLTKEKYAFDENRIELAKKLAREQELLLNPQASEKRLKSKERIAGSKEKRAMRKEQKGLVDTGGMLSKAITGKGTEGGIGNIKEDFKPLLKFIPFMKQQETFKERMQKRANKIRLAGKKFADKSKAVLDMAFKYFIFGIMAAIGFMILAAFLYKAYQEFQSSGIFESIKEIGLMIMTFGGMIFETIDAFTQGGMSEGMAKLKELGMYGLEILIATGYLLMEVGWELLLVAWDLLITFVSKFFGDAEFRDKIISGIWKIGKWIILAWAIKYFAGIVMTLVGVYALPIMIGVVLIAGLVMLWKKYAEPITNAFISLWTWVKGVFFSFIELIEDGWNALVDALTDDPDSGWWDTTVAPALGLHKGGLTHGNTNLVGEKGPELVKLPAGSRVYSNSQSRSMVGGSTTNNFNITINARDTSDLELRRIAEKIGSMVNNKMNRSTSSRTMG